MRLLVFFARVTFVCNLCYMIFVVGRYVDLAGLNKAVIGTIVVLGFTAFFLNIVTCLLWLVCLATKKVGYPIWLGIANMLFLIFQLVNILFLQL